MAATGSESPPHVPQPFPYIFAGPSVPILRTTSTNSFAHSSSRSFAPVAPTKRSRSQSGDGSSEDDSGDDEEMSLDDPYDLDKYAQEEVQVKGVDVDRMIEESNVGMRMLLKLGWTQGKGLGKELQGRVLPIDPSNNSGMMGLGKAAQDTRMLDTTSLKHELQSQRIAKETPDQRAARMERAAHKELVQSEITTTLRSFYCDLCSKQYSNVSQYDEHTNSYDHHHRARAVALKTAEREKNNATGESEKRRAKEAKREAKDMAKQMKAAGIKAPVVVKPVAASPVLTSDVSAGKAGAWAKFGGVGSVGGGFAPAKVETTPVVSTGFKKVGGWAAVNAASSSSPSTSSAVDTPPSSVNSVTTAPTFKSGGMFALSTEAEDDYSSPLTRYSEVKGPSQPPPPPPSSSAPPPPPCLPSQSTFANQPQSFSVPSHPHPATSNSHRPSYPPQVSHPPYQQDRRDPRDDWRGRDQSFAPQSQSSDRHRSVDAYGDGRRQYDRYDRPSTDPRPQFESRPQPQYDSRPRYDDRPEYNDRGPYEYDNRSQSYPSRPPLPSDNYSRPPLPPTQDSRTRSLPSYPDPNRGGWERDRSGGRR